MKLCSESISGISLSFAFGDDAKYLAEYKSGLTTDSVDSVVWWKQQI